MLLLVPLLVLLLELLLLLPVTVQARTAVAVDSIRTCLKVNESVNGHLTDRAERQAGLRRVQQRQRLRWKYLLQRWRAE